MEHAAANLFLATGGLLVIGLVGYPLFLAALGYLLPRHRPIHTAARRHPARLAVVVPFVNAQDAVKPVTDRLLASGYPKGCIEILLVDCGSSDATGRRIHEASLRIPEARFLVLQPRVPRAEAVRRASTVFPKCEIVVLLDPAVTIDGLALTKLVSLFDDPSVGVAGGRLLSHPLQRRVRVGWWRHLEHLWRCLESRFESSIGVNSLFYAVRRDLVEMLPPWSVAENFDLTLRAAERGLVARTSADAVAYLGSQPRGSENAALVEAVSGRVLSFFKRPSTFIPFLHPVGWQTFFHEGLRLLAPLLSVALVTSAFLTGEVFVWTEYLTPALAIFVAAAVTGNIIPQFGRLPGIGLLANLLRLNLNIIAGVFRGLFLLIRPAPGATYGAASENMANRSRKLSR